MNKLAELVGTTRQISESPPQMSFSEMADKLFRCAEQEAFSLEALNWFALRDPTGIGLGTIAEVRRQCSEFRDISLLLRALVPHEGVVRVMAASTGESR